MQPIFNHQPKSIKYILIITVVLHFLKYSLPILNQAFVYQYFAFIPLNYTNWSSSNIFSIIISPFSHMFLHDGLEHLLTNMALFLIFSLPIAKKIGDKSFLILYFSGGAGGVLLFYIFNSFSNGYLIGASGGISCLVGFFISITIKSASFRPLFNTKDIIFLSTLWLLSTVLYPLLFSQSIAWESHLGGFLTGVIFSFFHLKKSTKIYINR